MRREDDRRSTLIERVRESLSERPTHHHVHLGALAAVALSICVAGVIPVGDEFGLFVRVPLVALLLVGAATVSDRGHLARPRVVDGALGLLGALATWWLIGDVGVVGAVAIGAVGLSGGVLSRRTTFGAPVYVGSFVGGSATFVLPGAWWIAGAGLLAGLAWSLSREAWVGVGGKMGTMAFVATFVVSRVSNHLVHRVHVSGVDVFSHHSAAIVVSAILGATTTWLVADRLGAGPVIASSATSLAAALFFAVVLGAPVAPVLSSAWLGGSFVGMSATHRMGHPWPFLVAAGALFGTALVTLGNHFAGIGGTEGSIALVSVLVTAGARRVLLRLVRHRDETF